MLNFLKTSFKDSIIYGLGSVAVKLSGFILIPIYTKYFTVEEFGLLGFIEATSIILISIFSLSLYQAFFVWYWNPDYLKKQKSLVFTSLMTLFCIVIILCILTAVFSNNFSLLLFDNVKYKNLIFFMVTASGLQIISTIPAKLLQLKQKASFYTIANLLMLMTNITLTVILIVKYKYGLESIYISQTIGSIVYLLFLSPFIFNNLSFIFDKSILLKMLGFAYPLILASIASLVIAVSDRYILRFISGYKELGLYSFGAKLANTLTVILIGPVQLAVHPILVKLFNIDQRTRFYTKIMTYLCYILLIFIMIFSFFSKELVKVLAQQQTFWEAYRIIPILSFSVVFVMMKDLAGLHLQLIKRTGLLSKIIISMSIINIGLNFLLITYFGYFGASVSFLCSQIIYFILMHYFANKPIKIGYEYNKIIMMIIIAMLLIIISLLISNYSIWFRLSIKILLLLVFPILLYFFKFYEKVELEKISQLFSSWKDPRNWKQNLKRMFIE
jgi:O-antigen/teichoic acid export membrane protein